jgi:hypothetical protein
MYARCKIHIYGAPKAIQDVAEFVRKANAGELTGKHKGQYCIEQKRTFRERLHLLIAEEEFEQEWQTQQLFDFCFNHKGIRAFKSDVTLESESGMCFDKDAPSIMTEYPRD